MSRPYIPWQFGYSNTLPPSQLRRRVGDFIIFLMIGGTLLSILCGWAAYHAPFAKLPMSGYGQFLRITFKLFLNSISGGHLFNEQAPRLSAAIQENGLRASYYWRVAVSAISGFSGAVWMAMPMLRPQDGFIHLRGTRLFHAPDAIKRLKKSLPSGDAPFLHPEIKSVPAHVWGNGVYILGSPGSGKTTILMPFIKQIEQRGERALILDVKGDYTEKIGTAHILAPWDSRSVVWEVSKDITTEAQADALAAVLIRASQSDKNAIWSKAAQAVVSAIVKKLVAEKPVRWGFVDLSELLALKTEDWLKIMEQYEPAAAKVLQGAEQTSSSVAFNVATELKQVPRVAALFAALERQGIKKKQPRFSAKEWAMSEKGEVKQLILRYDEQNAGVVGFIVPFLVDYIATLLDSMPEQQKSIRWIVLDEFPQLPKIDRMRRFLEVGRSKGVRVILASQDPLQIEGKYGRLEADSLQSNATVSIFARINASHGQEQIARYLGTRSVAFYSVSTTHNAITGTSGQWQEKNEPLVLASELESSLGPLTNDKGVYGVRALLRISGDPINAAKSGGVFELDWPTVSFPKKREAASPMPHTKDGAAAALFYLAQAGKPLSEKVREILADEACAALSKKDLAKLLLIEGHIDRDFVRQHEKSVNQMIAAILQEPAKEKEPEQKSEGAEIDAEKAINAIEAIADATGNATIAHAGELAHGAHLATELIDALTHSDAKEPAPLLFHNSDSGEDSEELQRRFEELIR